MQPTKSGEKKNIKFSSSISVWIQGTFCTFLKLSRLDGNEEKERNDLQIRQIATFPHNLVVDSL